MIDSVSMPDEDDFERKLLLHCEAHAHEAESVSVIDTTFDEDEEQDEEQDEEHSVSVVDTTFDEDVDDDDYYSYSDDDDESNIGFTIVKIETTEQSDTVNVVSNDIISDAMNIVAKVQEEEYGIEVTMQRLCDSCAMDVTDYLEYQCPFCVAAKHFDLNDKDDSSSFSLCLDIIDKNTEDGSVCDKEGMDSEKEMDTDALAASAREDDSSVRVAEERMDDQNLNCVAVKHFDLNFEDDSSSRMICDQAVSSGDDNSTRRRRVKNKDQILKGMIATCLKQNKVAEELQWQPTTRLSTKAEKYLSLESRDDTFPLERQKPADNGYRKQYTRTASEMKAGGENFAHYSDLRRLNKFKGPRSDPIMTAKSSAAGAKHAWDFTHEIDPVDELDVRYQLFHLEKYYSKQQRRN